MEPAEYAAKRIREHDFGLSFSADPRFVNTHDQSRWCYTLFNDYLRCKDKLGEDAPRCQYLNQKTNVICPISYLDKYREWIDEGKWYGYKAKNEDN